HSTLAVATGGPIPVALDARLTLIGSRGGPAGPLSRSELEVDGSHPSRRYLADPNGRSGLPGAWSMATQAPQLTSAQALRRARERRGESLHHAADRTRISVHYLAALERDAPLGEYPSPMYARLFVRTYARYL